MWTSVKNIKIMMAFVTIFILFCIYGIDYNVLKFSEIERKLKIDRIKAPSEEIFVESTMRDIPYLPIEDLNNPLYENRNLNQTCAWYPSLIDIKIHNDYWQEYNNRNFSYYIFGAYFDNRPTVVHSEPVVRVLVMINFIGKSYDEYPLTYCQLWYGEQTTPFITPMKEMHKIWYYEWGHSLDHHYAHFITCPVLQKYKNRIPKTVSLVAQPCDKATNNVRVIYQPLFQSEIKQDFAVCIKGLDFPGIDMSHRMVEYIETLRTLGAKKITMYHLQVHPNTTKVLEYYQETAYLEYRPMSLSKAVSNLEDYRHLEMRKNSWSYILHEVIPYNDCLYRNMYRYKYVAVMDTDEVLMPVGNYTNWQELIHFGESIKTSQCTKFASFCFRCVYFPRYPEKPRYTSNIPEYFYMLQHVQRVRDHIRPDWATKCLHNTNHVIATHNHFPLHYINSVCNKYSFEASVAQLNHYREPDIKETLNDPVEDFNMWRFKDEIIQRSTKVFEELGFFSGE